MFQRITNAALRAADHLADATVDALAEAAHDYVQQRINESRGAVAGALQEAQQRNMPVRLFSSRSLSADFYITPDAQMQVRHHPSRTQFTIQPDLSALRIEERQRRGDTVRVDVRDDGRVSLQRSETRRRRDSERARVLGMHVDDRGISYSRSTRERDRDGSYESRFRASSRPGRVSVRGSVEVREGDDYYGRGEFRGRSGRHPEVSAAVETRTPQRSRSVRVRYATPDSDEY